MKKLKLLLLLVFPCTLIMTSCGSIQYGKGGGAKTVKMPFSEEDYVDNSTYVYSIQSTRGTGSKSAIKSATLTKAKNALSAKVRSRIVSDAKISQSGEDGGDFSESFNATINPESNGAGEVTVYKKYLNLLDREEQKVHISDGKIVFQSTESQTLLTVSTCQTA